MSSKMVLNKSADLTIKNSSDYRKYRKTDVEIKELKLQWNQKMKVLEESGFSQKEIISTNTEHQKLDDLHFSRKHTHPGPLQHQKQLRLSWKMKLRAKKKQTNVH